MLQMHNITKAFSGTLANDRVHLEVESGEVHALLGENGAGKSTLMSILYGLYEPQEGEIFLRGEPVVIHSPRKAIDLGIGMVHQHFMLVPALTALENIVMGLPGHRGFFLDRFQATTRIKDISSRYGLDVEPAVETWQLSVGVQQRVEILKALYRDARLLILDEPTAVLTPQESSKLFRVLRTLADQGHSIIFVTHKLEEVLEVCDRATVLRDGKNIATVRCADVSAEILAEMMVGREVMLEMKKEAAQPGRTVLEVEDLAVESDRGVPALHGVSFHVRAGEIVGVAGVDGNGQLELVETIAGLRPPETGNIRLLGQDITHEKIRVRSESGMAYIPEDRHRHGLILDFDLSDNLILRHYNAESFSRRGFFLPHSVQSFSDRLLEEYDVRSAGSRTLARTLSGGNQQKLILAREIHNRPSLLLASKPTRGLDVGAIEFVRKRFIEERDRGMAVLLISTDLEEILALSDRILILYEGQFVGELAAEDADAGTIGLMMAGGSNVTAEDRE